MRRPANHYRWDHQRPTAEPSEWPSTSSAALLDAEAARAAAMRPSRQRNHLSIDKLLLPFALFLLLGGIGVEALARLLHP